MVSFFKAISKIKKRGTPLQKKRKESRKHGSIECVCKKSKKSLSYSHDITIGGKLITRKAKNSPVNHIRLKGSKGMSEPIWLLTGGVDNPCRCSLVAGTLGLNKGKRRVLKGVNMVQIKYR
jgi:hypothetical protein